MHVYIVFAHPSRATFSDSVLKAFTRGLQDAGHSYEIGDLYRTGFKSEMDAGQYHREVGLDPGALNGAGGCTPAPDGGGNP